MPLTRITITGADDRMGAGARRSGFVDMTGQRIGMLVVRERTHSRSKRPQQVYWLCDCDCGRTTAVSASRLRDKKPTSSCGCLRGKYEHRKRPLSERFWEKVRRAKADECWEWTASRNRKGYGEINLGVGLGTELSNRMAYKLSIGPIPDGMHVLHRCDNPPCCNPAHLFLGTNADNMADKAAKGRFRSRLTREEAANLVSLAKKGASVEELSSRFGLLPYSVDAILNGKTWRSLYAD